MKKVISILVSVLMIAGLFAYPKASGESKNFSLGNAAPPNEGRIARTLINEGKIPKDATQQEIDKAVQEYLKQKLKADPEEAKKEQKLFEDEIKKVGDPKLDYENLIHGRAFGKDLLNPGKADEKSWNGEVKKSKLLILLAEFGDDDYDKGPLHNQIEKPGPENNTDLWVNDFSREHYKKMLFTKGGYDAVDKDGKALHLNSMVDFYLEQSGGSYLVDGDVYGWYKLSHSEAYYGDDAASGHDNKLPGTSKDLVRELLTVAANSGEINWNDYDVEDPGDVDKDGNYFEADGIIDRLVVVHAGVDQSGGGGAQGANALWAHSSSVGAFKIPGTNKIASKYIMQGEDGAIGVFCHEFGHNLGVPDEYDTIYSGKDASTGFFSLMGSGSWAGYPLGAIPTGMSPWARMRLQSIYGGNWYNVKTVKYEDITSKGMSFVLNQSTSRGNNPDTVRVDLPQQKVPTIAPYEGSYEWFSGKADNLNAKLTSKLSVPNANQAVLDYMIWYSTEKDYDYGYIEALPQGASSWTVLKKFDGSSNGWINEKIDLSEFKGMNIELRFRYYTDGGTLEQGIFLDNIKVIADNNVILQDNVEAENSIWQAEGWTRHQGFNYKNQYYLIEWRSFNKTGASNKYCYNYVDSVAGIAEFFRLEPGMVIWYVNEAYTDNWVGVHPGYGYLGVVDAHPEPMLAQGVDVRSRVSTRDAAFNYIRVPDATFTLAGKKITYQGKQAVPVFSDTRTFWHEEAPSSGLKIPSLGLKIKVVGQAEDYSTGQIVIYK